MKKLFYTTIKLLSFSLMMLVITNTVSASRPQYVEITFKLDFTGPFTAAGDFWISGAIEDSGTASQVFRITDEGTLQGKKVLEGQDGSITLRFNAEPTPSGEAIGHFVILSGTGAYENIHGRGTTFATILMENSALRIVGSYSGEAHLDP